VEPTERILVADDDIDMLHLVSVRLTAAGFDVLQSTSGDSALELAQAEMPTLSVLDVMMPGLSGLEVCRALRNNPRTAHMPVVLLSARAEEIDRILGLEMGADDYLTKPFSPRELLLRIESILSRKRRNGNGDALLSVGKISLNREEHRIVSNGESGESHGLRVQAAAGIDGKSGPGAHARCAVESRLGRGESDRATDGRYAPAPAARQARARW
jgi:DNA-binding response OmpR family regulator